MRKVCSSAPNGKLQHFFALYRPRNTNIDRKYIHSEMFCHQTHGGLAAAHIFRDRGCHLLPALRHALGDHAVVRAENNRRASGNIRHRLTEDTRKLHNRVLQKTQTAEWHGNICETVSRRRHAFLIQRSDGRNSLFKCHFPLLSAHFRTKFAAISVFARKYKCGNPA